MDEELAIIKDRLHSCEKGLALISSNRSEIEMLLQRVAVLEANVANIKSQHIEADAKLRVITDGYQTILHEVRETRASVETLFQRQAASQLTAVERYSVLLKWTMRGVFAITSGVVALAAIHAVLTGNTLSASFVNIVQSIFGT